jgi:predicted O-methyltransferase YrrM
MNDTRIDEYIERHSSEETPLLRKIRRETHLRTVYPQMLSGPIQGKLLEMVSRMIKPQRILEIGTFTGYSAICLAYGLREGGRLFTIDSNQEMTHIASKYFMEAGLQDSILTFTGSALDIIPELKESFDLVFIDAAKEEYPEYYNLVINIINPGGYIIADNVLWDGKVLEDPEMHDRETRAITAFNTLILKDNRVEQVMLPVRDGLTIIRVKES